METGLSEEVKKLPFLVAESNSALRKIITDTLKRAGVENCGEADNGVDAWQAWKRSREIGVLIIAWHLPEMMGLEVMRRIRGENTNHAQPAVVMIAQEDSTDMVGTVVSEGADCFLPKPFPSEKLIPSVIEAVAHRKQVSGLKGEANPLSLEEKILGKTFPGELLFERYSTSVDCEQLSMKSAVIRVTNNYGLGTVLNLRLVNNERGEGDFFQPIRGIVTKVERVPKEYGIFLLHLQFNNRVKENQGIGQLVGSSV